MKKLYITIITILAFAVSSVAQPRAVGLKVGPVLEASYQHSVMRGDAFIQADFGFDYLNYGYKPGTKATATYNMIIGHPQWGGTNDWNFYVGPGISIGYVGDSGNYDYGIEEKGSETINGRMGFMTSLVFQVGIEYNFAFPLQISCDLRPMFGFHICNDYTSPEYGYAKGGFQYYDSGVYGFIPSISVRYRF